MREEGTMCQRGENSGRIWVSQTTKQNSKQQQLQNNQNQKQNKTTNQLNKQKPHCSNISAPE